MARVNIIEYVTIASVGNTTDFGNLTLARGQVTATASSTRGLFLEEIHLMFLMSSII